VTGRTSDHPLALACLAFLDVGPEEHVAAAAAAGFDDVTLRVTGTATPTPAQVGADSRRAHAIRASLDAAGLGVRDVEVLRLVPDLDLDEVARVVETAAVLGARHLLVVNGALERAAATDLVGRVVGVTEGSGVRPCLEPMLFSRCRTLVDAIETVATTGAGVLVDALHLFRAGSDAHAVREAARVHGPGLFPYLQVCDAGMDPPTGDDALREEAVNGRLLPGEGSLPLTGLLAALPPGLPLSVEAPTRALRQQPAGVRATEAMRAVRALL